MAVGERRKFRFDFAISYASEEQGIAGDLFRALTERGARVFFDLNEKAYLLGKSLESELIHIFGPRTRFAVPLVSKHYVKRYWPKFEFRVATKEARDRPFEVILPVLIDEVRLTGLESDVVYINYRKVGLYSTADVMIRKLEAVLEEEERVLDIAPYRVKPETREYTDSLISSASSPETRFVPRYWVVALGIDIEALVESDSLPPQAPDDYARLCDWLESDLMERLFDSSLGTPTLMEDFRSGESLSVRIGFEWDPRRAPLGIGDIGWWEILAIEDFADIYPDQNPQEAFEE